MIVNVVRSTPKPEFKQQFIQHMGELAQQVRQEAGNIRYEILVDPHSENGLVLYEEWEDQAALDRHLAQPHMIKHHEEARPGFDGKIEMVTYEVTTITAMEF